MFCDRCKEEPLTILYVCERCDECLCEVCYGDPTLLWCEKCEKKDVGKTNMERRLN